MIIRNCTYDEFSKAVEEISKCKKLIENYQIIDLIIRITGLVISAVMLGIAITKNNRH